MALSATEHGKIVLSAIVPQRRDNLDRALRQLTVEHFPEVTHRTLFAMLERYAEVTGSVMSRSALADILSRSNSDAGKVALYEETYDLLAATSVSDADFAWSLEQVRELAADRATAEAITQAMEILQHGAQDEKGNALRGHVDARTHVLQAFAEIDKSLSMQESPEGDMRVEGSEMMKEYEERKKLRLSGGAQGVQFGVEELDNKLGSGLQAGELALIAGYTSAGKSSWACQLAWHAAVVQGMDVIYATTETLRPQVRRKIISRHSRLDMFDLPDGLNSLDLRMASLPDHLESKFQDVVHDFNNNPSYGHLDVMQLPSGSTGAMLASRIARTGRDRNLKLLVVDYAQLLKPDRKRATDREEQGGTIKDLKQLGVTYGDGAGLAIASPWQVSRGAYEEAQQCGYYVLAAMSQTSEASNTPDVIVSILEPKENNSRYVEIRSQILKARDGETSGTILVDGDYATSYFSSKVRAGTVNDLLG